MRAVTSATAAETLRISRRRLDSILNRLGEAAIAKGRQGVDRRIPVQLLETLMLAVELERGLELPVVEAFERARQLLASSPDATASEPRGLRRLPVGEHSALLVDVDALRARVEEHLGTAIESVVKPRRGRPRAHRSRTDAP